MDCAASSGLVLLTQNHIVHLVNVFIHAGTSWSATALMSVHCAHVSELLEQPVNATCRPFFVRKFCPQQLSRITLCLKKTSHLWLAIILMHVNGF